MRLLHRLGSLWRNTFRGESTDADLQREIGVYLQLLVDRKIQQGTDPREARREALIELGGVEPVKEMVREVRMGHHLDTITKDLRYGVRMLAKSPVFTAVAVLTLALGVGANSAIFSVIDAVLLKPLPFKQSDRLVRVYTTAFGGVLTKVTSRQDFADWKEQNDVFEQMTIYGFAGNTLTGIGEPRRLNAAEAGPDFFALFGVEPILGRTFLPDEHLPNSGGVVLLAEQFWKQQFGSDPNIVGRSLTVDGHTTTVIGVVPDRFETLVGPVQMWHPFLNQEQNRGNRNFWAIGRLKSGVTTSQANAEIEGLASRLEQLYHDTNFGWGATVVSLQESIVGDSRLMLLILLGAVGLILLIACANVANLLLARAATRAQELAIRSSLGASRGRLVRQLLTEGLLLSTLGGALAFLLAFISVKLLTRVNTNYIPRIDEVRLDSRVIGFTLLLSVVTTFLFALAPALRISTGFNETLKEAGRGPKGGRRNNRIRSLLVVSELAISMVLLIGCGLLIRSFYQLGSVQPGFEVQGLTKAQIVIKGDRYKAPDSQQSFYDQLVSRLDSLSGAESAALCTTLPLDGNGYTPWVEIGPEGRPFVPEETLNMQIRQVSPGYFRTMKIPLITGRDFNRFDRNETGRVIALSESLAHRMWPGVDPVGKRLRLGPEESLQVIAVVGDVKRNGLDTVDDIAGYVSCAQYPSDYLTVVARSKQGGANLIAAIKEAVQSIDKDLAIFAPGTMEEVRSNTLARRRFNLLLLSILAGLALFLSAIGTYGVISYSVTERGQEIGIRMALGAKRWDVTALVVGQAVRLAVAGTALGLVAAAALTRVMESLLFKVSATDPVTFALIAAFLIVISLIAAYLPARRATRIDPMAALRYE